MDERKERIASNEAILRVVNEQIEGLNRGVLEATVDQDMGIVCECGQMSCGKQLTVPISDYERIRSNPLLFFVIPGHETPDLEDVVEQTDVYLVVRKRPEGIGGQIAIETDPRSD